MRTKNHTTTTTVVILAAVAAALLSTSTVTIASNHFAFAWKDKETSHNRFVTYMQIYNS